MKLLYLSALSFVFVSSFALSLSQNKLTPIYPSIPAFSQSQLPILSKTTSFPLVSAQGVIAMDLNSAVVLYEKNANSKLLPASTTKIMTALVAINHFKQEDVIKVGAIKNASDSQIMGLFEGEEITFRGLLDGLLIYSANDAAEAIAHAYPGGREAFIAAMNQKAKDLGLVNTSFRNPSGLDEEGHYSTAKDMVRLSAFGISDPLFSEVVSTKEKVVKSIDGKFSHHLKNINKLLGSVDGIVGIKTGWTENARENLITAVKRGDRTILIGILGSQDRFGETKEIIDWVFSSYVWTDVSPFGEIEEKITKIF